MAADVQTAERYKVRNGPVLFSLRVGEGQFGRSDVFLDDQKLIRASGSIHELLIGSNLAGKTLVIRTLGVDVNTQSNKMSLTYRLTGGVGVHECSASGKVINEGGTLVFETSISLIAAT